MTNFVAVTPLVPVESLLGGTDNTIISGDNSVTLPLSTEALGGNNGFYGGIALTTPIPVEALASGIGAPIITLPLPVVAFSSGIPGPAVNTTIPQESLGGYTGIDGDVSVTGILPIVGFAQSNGINAVPLAPVEAFTGVLGVTGFIQLNAPLLTEDLEGNVPYTAQLAEVPFVPKEAITGTVGVVGSTVNQLREVIVAMSGYAGVIGSTTVTLPLIQESLGGVEVCVGSVTVTVPLAVVQMIGTTQVAVGTQQSTIVMHTESQALTTYTNYNFNSLAKFNGVYLGANANGIYALTGDTDDGAIIQASARVGITDFGTSHMKRVDRCYVGYRTSGDLMLRVFTDEINVRDYLLTATGKTGLHGNHLRIGKGLAARYWQFEIQNRFGADFTMNVVEVKPTVLRRRIGGGDG